MPLIRVGVAGLGRRGRFHLERLSLRDDYRLVAAHDPDPAGRETAAAFGCRWHESWPGLLADSEVDLVLIAAPPAAHAPLALAALKAGRHVVVEKPLCLTVADADALVARSAGRLLTVAHTRRWDGEFRTVERVVASGALGRITAAALIVWERRIAEEGAAGWRADTRLGGGALAEFGSHYFDQLLRLVPEQPVGVWAWTAPPAEGRSCDEAFSAFVTFSGGATARVDVNLQGHVPFHSGWMLSGTEGGWRHQRRYVLAEDGELFDVPVDPLPTEWDRFYDGVTAAVRGGAEPPVSAVQAREVVALIEAARESARTGRVVQLPWGG